MRVVGEIPHEACKITIFAWNNKYLIKLERGVIEQTFKVSEMDVTGDEDIKKMLEGKFMEKALSRFEEMEASLFDAIESLY
ncbi:hypothetical protein OKW21_005655 [Catalinimonas alkaloidigena]|uniref:hypothetical protein n=1 Tax=Catalinimonas alkaloidigena TaxID=1075417 RepID=UPI0024051ED8|nr:hypothetical protein [Catalinimonas alkaloidigena]MDF9800392.1 hypothetical protein [Catalinimonas alkaloidigena]